MLRTQPKAALRQLLSSAGLVLLAGAVTGCASLQMDGEQRPLVRVSSETMQDEDAKSIASYQIAPRGPGALFMSPEDAAIDALAYCYLTSQAGLLDIRRAAGGAIQAVDGGFSYEEPSVAGSGASERLRYAMGRRDVAHFNYYPQRTLTRKAVEREQRRVVEELDPAHRPLYTLSADRLLTVYEAGPKGHEALARMSPILRRSAGVVALSRSDFSASSEAMPGSSVSELR